MSLMMQNLPIFMDNVKNDIIYIDEQRAISLEVKR